jgi:hypothetical protein
MKSLYGVVHGTSGNLTVIQAMHIRKEDVQQLLFVDK